MPSRRNRKELLSFPISVTGHISDEKADDDKPDTFTVSFEEMSNVDGSLEIALQPAKARIKIKALDDVVKSMFPNGHQFMLVITERYESQQAPENKVETEPTTLDQQPGHQELCPDCKLPLALCACATGTIPVEPQAETEEIKEEPIPT